MPSSGSLLLTCLLVLSPQYLKVDIKLQRGLPTGPTKQAFGRRTFGGSHRSYSVAGRLTSRQSRRNWSSGYRQHEHTDRSSINSPPLSMPACSR
jgi:hypothetical protein